jgi:hypothetical protein
MRKITTLWIVAALAAISFGVGCKSEKQPPPKSTTTPSVSSSNSTYGDPFLSHLPKSIQLPVTNKTAGFLLYRYGAVLVASGGIMPPPVIVFSNEDAVQRWQSSITTERTQIDGIAIELQAPAMTSFLEARKEAIAVGLDITPRGKDASKRDYADTMRLWESRVKPGLAHWVALHKLDATEAKRIAALSPLDQAGEILRLERDGIWFSPSFKSSIFSSVAPPGASQHLSMLALDINEHNDRRVRAILARHGWFQSVEGDLPHFTYLGVAEAELSGLGLLKTDPKESPERRAFWVPKEIWIL